MPDSRRYEYEGERLDFDALDPDPLTQFRRWFDDAVAADVVEPAAMTLATVDADGRPAARAVLLRGLDERGFAFYTNLESAKARDLDAHPHAALAFGWLALHRAVRVIGAVSPLPDDDVDTYFSLRPRGAQLGAWASPQSAVIGSREELEQRVAAAAERFAGGDVPRPPHWGGYVVAPSTIELWQGRRDRLHDRARYRRDGDRWALERLAP